MYGKYVTIGNSTVWVWGTPSMTEAEWIKAAQRLIASSRSLESERRAG